MLSQTKPQWLFKRSWHLGLEPVMLSNEGNTDMCNLCTPEIQSIFMMQSAVFAIIAITERAHMHAHMHA